MRLTPLPLSEIRKIELRGLQAGLPLMQRAGQAVAHFVTQRLLPGASILVLAGPGNNGGDALVAAKQLKQALFIVRVVMPRTDTLPADARLALQGWHDAGGSLLAQLPLEKPDLVVDGLFGIGLNRPLASPWQEMIDTVNAWNVPVLAIDIPSGLEADTGRHLGRPIRATWTMSFIAPTLALFSQSCKALAGELTCETLGLSG